MTKKQKTEITKLIREIALIRDKNRCLRCGKTSVLHLSHIYPKGKYRRLELDIDNVKILCSGCHLYFWHKHPIEASEWIKTVLPAKRLRDLKKKSITNMGLKEPISYEFYKQKYEKMLENIKL